MNAEPTPDDRRTRLAIAARAAGVDAVVVSPGADLQYLTGVSVGSHERLSCLVVTAPGEAFLLVPTLERPGWTALDGVLPITTWSDGSDPYGLLASLLDAARVVAVDEDMPVGHAWRLRNALPGTTSGWRETCWPVCGCANRPKRSPNWRRWGRRSTGCIGTFHVGCTPAAPSTRWPRTSPRPWSRTDTPEPTSSSSDPVRTGPAPTMRPPTGSSSPGIWWWSTSAARITPGTSPTAPAPTRWPVTPTRRRRMSTRWFGRPSRPGWRRSGPVPSRPPSTRPPAP